MKPRNFPIIASLLFSLGALSACGGDSGDSESATTISGSVFASGIGGATVTVEDTGGNTVAGPVTTGSGGSFTVDVPDDHVAGDLVFRSSGGTFTDEASGDSGVAGGALGAYVAGGSLDAGAEVHLTPASSIVEALVSEHGLSLAEAEAAYAASFGLALAQDVAPLDATLAPAAGADQQRIRAGLRAAAFSQLAIDLGLDADEQFALFHALADDLSDGTLDGESATGAVMANGTSPLPADIQNRFERALMNFRAGGRDNSGLTADAIGALPFAKVALTDSYRIDYAPGARPAREGKTAFSLNITDRNTGLGVDGLAVTLAPMMYMAGMSHGTAVDGCDAGATSGRYDCTVYYLMASSMANGMSMGYWDLRITLDGSADETAHLYPAVAMAMGDTTRAVLKGQADQIAAMGMGMPEARNYYLFMDEVSGTTGNHEVALFIAARESLMSHPAVSVGTVLNAGDMDHELTVTTMTVELSTDGNAWTAATDNGGGHWSTEGLSGLTNGTQGELYVRLTVNGEQKTTDGAAPNGSNDHGTFQITPGM